MSTFTTNKGIEQPTSGSYNNTWDVPVNADWGIIDNAFGGTTNLNATGASGTNTLALAQYQPPNIVITGTLSANVVYSIPSGVGGLWTIYNNTSGAYTVAFASGGGGTAVTLQQGARTQVVSDGTNIQLANNNIGVVPIVNGGTGASTAATAASNLLPSQSGNTGKYLTTDGSALSWGTPSGGGGGGGGTVTGISTATGGGTNGLTLTGGPITTSGTITLGGSISNLSLTTQVAGTLPVANGGTGLSSTPGIGQIDIGNGSGFTRNTLTAGTGISISSGAGSITISATGGGSVTGSGTANYVPKFTGASSIGNSLIYDNGTNVGIGTTTPANTLDVFGTIGGSSIYASGFYGNRFYSSSNTAYFMNPVGTSVVDEINFSGGYYLSALADSFFTTNSSYQKTPSGMIIQWGISASSVSTSGSLAVTFATTFPNSCDSVVVTRIGTSTGNSFGISVGTVSATGFTYYSSGAIAGSFYWVAIGH